MHPVVFETPWYTLHWENVMIIIGILGGVWLVQRRSAHKGEAYQNAMLDLAIWLVPAGILGARIWEMIWVWNEYVDRPWERLAFWNGGMSIQGSILGGLVAALIFAWHRRIRIWELLDILAPGVLLGQAVGRIGCLLSGDAFGRPVVEVPWWPQWFGLVYAPNSPAGTIYGPIPLIPAEALEGLLDFFILGFLLVWKPRREVPGRTVLVYAVAYSVARFGLEFLRADSLLIGGLKVAQLLSLAVIAICTTLLAVRFRVLDQTEKAAG